MRDTAQLHAWRFTYKPLSHLKGPFPDSSHETAPSNFNGTKARETLDKVEQSLEESIDLVFEFEYYAAAKSFDNASKMFIAMFAEEQK